MVLYCALTALIEEPAKMIIMEKSSDATSIQGSFSASAKHVASKMQETSFSSTSMSDVKFESMSASSMSSMSSEAMMAMSSSSMMAMSSSSMMAMSSHSHVEGSSIRAISRGHKGEMDTHSVHLCIKHLKRRTVKHQQTCLCNTTKIYFFPRPKQAHHQRSKLPLKISVSSPERSWPSHALSLETQHHASNGYIRGRRCPAERRAEGSGSKILRISPLSL